jgi:alpha-beta hydrolase superfamily lysophospholipase
MPLFLFGHSLGGVVAVLCALEEQTRLSGLVTSSGAFRPAHIPSKPAFLAARILSPIVPHLKLSGGLKPELLSHDPKVVANYQADPLVQSEVTIRWGVEFFGAYEQAISRAGELSLPLLVMQGEADGIATLEGARAFFAQAGSADKKLRTYPGLRHELFNELPEQRRHVLADLTQWLVAHVEAR